MKLKLENFRFLSFLVISEEILITMNKVSKSLQQKEIDLLASTRLLSMAYAELEDIRDSWDRIMHTSAIASNWKIDVTFKIGN